MYVRAYSNGVRHGNEATWRSDGTPLSLPADGSVPPMDDDLSADAEAEDSLPNLELPQPATLPQSNDDSGFDFAPTEEPVGESLPNLSFPESESGGEREDDGFSDLPSFPPMEDEDTLDSSADKLPELPTSEESLPNFPDEPVELPTDSPSLPGLPGDDTEELPDLPALDEGPNSVDTSPLLPGEQSDDIGLPPLPGENDGGLPPLPGMEDEGGLPPLPGGDDGGFGDLPPLPPLP
jgi:hypothetical protein